MWFSGRQILWWDPAVIITKPRKDQRRAQDSQAPLHNDANAHKWNPLGIHTRSTGRWLHQSIEESHPPYSQLTTPTAGYKKVKTLVTRQDHSVLCLNSNYSASEASTRGSIEIHSSSFFCLGRVYGLSAQMLAETINGLAATSVSIRWQSSDCPAEELCTPNLRIQSLPCKARRRSSEALVFVFTSTFIAGLSESQETRQSIVSFIQ